MENLSDNRNSEQIKIAEEEANEPIRNLSSFLENDWLYNWISPRKESDPHKEEENLIIDTPPKMGSGDSNSNFTSESLVNSSSLNQEVSSSSFNSIIRRMPKFITTKKSDLKKDKKNKKDKQIFNFLYEKLHDKYQNASDEKTRSIIQHLYHDLKLNPTEIRKITGKSRTLVYKWIKRTDIKPKIRQRKLKMKDSTKDFIINECKGKQTIRDNASSRKIADKVISQNYENHICHSTVNNLLRKELAMSRKIGKTFYLTHENKIARVKFAQMIIDDGIKGKDIFFTDEKKFQQNPSVNSQINRIRFDKDQDKKLRQGDPVLKELTMRGKKKFEDSFMVCGGISYFGLSKLVFLIGTMDGKAYSQCLDHYLEDLKRLDNLAGRMLIFQQDGAPAHTTGYCLEKIKKNRTVFKQRWKHLAPLAEYKNYFDKGIFPSNSPDLTPIEMVWAILEYELSKKEYKTLEDKKLELIRLWNSFPLTLCQSLINKFDENVKWIVANNGERVSGEGRKRMRTPNGHSWLQWNHSETIENICYKMKTAAELKRKKLKKITVKINKAIKKVKEEIKDHKDFNKKNINYIKKNSPSIYHRIINAKENYEKDLTDQLVKPLETWYKDIEMKDNDEFIKHELKTNLLSMTSTIPVIRMPEEFLDEDDLIEGSTDNSEYDE